MSRVNQNTLTACIVSALAIGSCATAAAPPPRAATEADLLEQAMADAAKPATADEIAAAERSDPLTRASFWNEEYRKNAGDLDTTVSYLKSLRAIGSHDRVAEIAQLSLTIHPDSSDIYMELGRTFMAQNKPDDAIPMFARAADFAPMDDPVPLAALGLAFDRTENHGQAQQAYLIALERDPDRVKTLTNYGLSLALTGDLSDAERMLRRAVDLPGADVRVRQNLILILGLQGKHDEIEAIDPFAPRRTREANRKVLEEMTSISSTPEQSLKSGNDPEPPKRLTLRPTLDRDDAS